MAISLLTLFLLFLSLLSLLIFLKKPKNSNPPPSPPKLPIIGNLHQIGNLPHQHFRHLSEKYGPVFLLHLGRVKTIIISSAETAKQVLKDHDLDCCTRPQFTGTGKLVYNYSDMAFSPYGAYWREIKKICVLELFSAKRVQSFHFIREEEIDLMIESIKSSIDESVIDITKKLFSLTANVTFRIAFGKSFRGSDFDNERFQKVIHEIVVVLGSFCGSDYFGKMGRVLDWVMDRNGRIERVFKELDGFFQKVIDEHLDFGRVKGEEDIVDVLLKIEKEQIDLGGGTQFSQNNIKAILFNIFLGGIDTGAITMEWAMAELIRNSRAMKKVQHEIRNYIGQKGKVLESDLDNFPYLRMIIKETFRLHPPAPLLLPREAMNHFKINGYDIAPNTLIQINVWAIGRNPNHWEREEEFYPERFEGSGIDYKGQNYELLPFGGGRRGCPGIYMGIVTIELGLANLLYWFDWKLGDGIEGVDLEESTGLSLSVSKKNALMLVPVKHF